MINIKKVELEARIKELEDKIKELNDKYEETDDHNQMLLIFNAHITRLCLQNTQGIMTAKNPKERDTVEMFFRFNVHSFVNYFGREMFTDYKPNLRENEEFLDGWNKHVHTVLNPLYKEELDKIDEKYNPKKEAPSYVL